MTLRPRPVSPEVVRRGVQLFVRIGEPQALPTRCNWHIETRKIELQLLQGLAGRLIWRQQIRLANRQLVDLSLGTRGVDHMN
jgi:hypothetical protein